MFFFYDQTVVRNIVFSWWRDYSPTSIIWTSWDHENIQIIENVDNWSYEKSSLLMTF